MNTIKERKMRVGRPAGLPAALSLCVVVLLIILEGEKSTYVYSYNGKKKLKCNKYLFMGLIKLKKVLQYSMKQVVLFVYNSV